MHARHIGQSSKINITECSGNCLVLDKRNSISQSTFDCMQVVYDQSMRDRIVYNRRGTHPREIRLEADCETVAWMQTLSISRLSVAKTRLKSSRALGAIWIIKADLHTSDLVASGICLGCLLALGLVEHAWKQELKKYSTMWGRETVCVLMWLFKGGKCWGILSHGNVVEIFPAVSKSLARKLWDA